VYNEGDGFIEKRQLKLGDMEKILQVLGNIMNYLYSHYGEYEQTEKEASKMFKTLIDPEVLEKGRKKGLEEGLQKGLQRGMEEGKIAVACNLLKLGVDIGTIAEATGLSQKEVEGLNKRA